MRITSRWRLIKLSIFTVLLAVIVSSLGIVGRARLRAPSRSLFQENQSVALKTEDGVLFIWNRPGLHFTLLMKGNDVVPMKDPEHIFFTVDGLILQIQSLPVSNFAPDAKRNKLDDKSILAAHRDWESKFLETELLKSKLTLKSSNEKVNGTDVLVWQYDLPAAFRNPDASGQVYATTVAGDFVILLNSVLSPSVSDSQARKLLLNTMGTLKLSAEPFDIKKLQDEVRKGP
jgi:hypothetical protein